MKTIGLTGGIGSGKTTIANYFKELGVPIYIADNEAKRLMFSPSVQKEICELLGKDAYIENQPNRSYIASKVFKDELLLQRLNKIIHPRVEKHFKTWLQKQKAAYVIYEAAILFETGKYKNFDYIVLVSAPEEVRIQRVQQRDHTSVEEIKARMNKQWKDDRKRKYADFIIQNEKLKHTHAQVLELHKTLLMLINA